MNLVPLLDYCRPKQWPTLSAKGLSRDGYPVYGANGVIGYHDTYTHDKPVLLVGCRGSCGSLHITKGKIYANGNAMAIDQLSEDVDLTFLYHYLRHRGLRDAVTGTSQPQITQTSLRKVTIPLLKLDEQRRIADILDQADALRRKQQEAIQLADDYLKSYFLSLFGDPITNNKNLPLVPLTELGLLERGKSRHRPRNDPALLGGNHPLIQTGEVTNAWGYIRSYTQTYSDLGLSQSRKWPRGTLCITIAANIAKSAILDFDACFPDSVVGFTPGDGTTSEFILGWIGFYAARLEAIAPKVAQSNINLRILGECPVALPDKSLQMMYSDVFRHVHRIGVVQQQALIEATAFFASLSDASFGDASRNG